MAEIQRKNTFSKVLYSKGMILVLLFIFVLFLLSVVSMYQKRAQALNKVRVAQEELNRAKEKQQSMDTSLDSLKTDKGVEDALREKFQIAKEGEGLVVITGDNEKTTSATSTNQPMTLWQKFKAFFIK